MTSKVSIPDTFNGPMGLLYSLIIRDEIDIYDIPIAKVTASYCEEIAKMEHINIDEEGEFLLLASRLKDIKLRMLFPPEEGIDEEENDDEYDPRSSLVEALLEYRRFKDAARLLEELADEQSRRYPRLAPRMDFSFTGDTQGDADSHSLLRALQTMLTRMVQDDKEDPLQERKQTEIPISRRIEQIEAVIASKGSARLSRLLSDIPNRAEMVGFFMAILELMRRGFVHARQTEDFSDIILEPRKTDIEKKVAIVTPARRYRHSFPPAITLRRRQKSVALPKPVAPFPTPDTSGIRQPRSQRRQAIAFLLATTYRKTKA